MPNSRVRGPRRRPFHCPGADAFSGVDSAGKGSIHSPTASHGPIVVPTPMPFLILRINDLVAECAFRVPVAKQQDRTAIMTVGRPLARSGGVDICIESAADWLGAGAIAGFAVG